MRNVKVLLLLTLAGCASMQNTPAQEATWARLNKCPAMGNVTVNTDGSWRAYGSDGAVDRLVACMREQGSKVNKN